MNSTKIIIPSPLLLSFYYHYSNFVLIITWPLTLLLFYVILTQSKNMKNFKWLILFQSFWGIFFETTVCLAKPLFLAPAPAGIPLGLFRSYGSFYISACGTLLFVFAGINYAVGLAVTTVNRYILAFPSKFTEYLNFKIVLCLTIPFYIAFYTAVAILSVQTLSLDVEVILQKSKKYDPFFESFNEISLLFVPFEYAQHFGYFIFLSLNGLFAACIIVIFIFIYLVRKSATQSVTRIQRSMIISSIVEISIICIFFLLPVNVITGCVIFQVPDSSWIAVICGSLFTSHGIIDAASTMYFVLPYRRYIKQQLLRLMRRWKFMSGFWKERQSRTFMVLKK